MVVTRLVTVREVIEMAIFAEAVALAVAADLAPVGTEEGQAEAMSRRSSCRAPLLADWP